MKRHLSLFSFILIGVPMLLAQPSTAGGTNSSGGNTNGQTVQLRKVNNKAFTVGEELTYRLHYGLLDAGEATLSVQNYDKKVRGRSLYRIVGKGESKGAFNWFFKVDDRYETYVDQEGIFPWVFVRRVNEGGYKLSQDYLFHQHKQEVTTEKGNTHSVPVGVQDMLSAFYYARTIDFTNAAIGDTFTVECFLDEELYPLKIKFAGREEKKTKTGRYNCLIFNPIVQKGRIFKKEEDLQVWITDDENKIPVLVKANILVGSIKMELTDHKGVANPLNLVP